LRLLGFLGHDEEKSLVGQTRPVYTDFAPQNRARSLTCFAQALSTGFFTHARFSPRSTIGYAKQVLIGIVSFWLTQKFCYDWNTYAICVQTFRAGTILGEIVHCLVAYARWMKEMAKNTRKSALQSMMSLIGFSFRNLFPNRPSSL